MKRSASFWPSLILAALCFLLPTLVEAQSFQGSVKYSIRLSGKGAAVIMMNEPATKMDLHVSGGNYIMSLYGGRIPRTFLFIADSSETYSMDMVNRRAYRNTYYRDTSKIKHTAIATGKTMNIKGNICNEFEVKKPENGETVYYYVCDKYKVDLTPYAGKKDAKADFLTDGLEGRIPLRKVIKTAEIVTEIDMLSITVKELDKENFQIPANFIIRKRDPRY